jgi:hypothetical protein
MDYKKQEKNTMLGLDFHALPPYDTGNAISIVITFEMGSFVAS